MTTVNDILGKLKLPATIWEIADDDTVKCVNTNTNKYKKGKTYVKEKNDIQIFDCIESKTDFFMIKNDGDMVEFSKINDVLFIEIHYFDESYHLMCSVSSKIREPLTNVIGVLSLIDISDLPSHLRKYFSVINKSSFEIVKVLNDLIDLINLRNEKLQMSMKKCEIKAIIDEIIHSKNSQMKKNKTDVKYNIKTSVPDIILTDGLRLKQVLQSLIDNAIKHTINGIVKIVISSKKKKGKYQILFKIQDTGSGMDSDVKRSVDNILGVAKNGKLKPYKNCGFGLMICALLCDLMGGKLWYKSELDMGTIFFFRITCEGWDI